MKDLNICALSTARAGSKSVKDKNILDLKGTPLFAHPIKKANNSKYISSVFCSSDHPQILNSGDKYQYTPITRPEELCGDNSPHQSAIIHGLQEIEKKKGKLDYIVILLGNSIGAEPEDIDSAIESIGTADSIVSVNEMNMFNPSRAWLIKNNHCETYIPQNELFKKSSGLTNDKNAFGDIYFFNGNFFITKRDAVFKKGNAPFTWLGKTIKPYIQKNVFMEIDAEWQRDYILKCKNF